MISTQIIGGTLQHIDLLQQLQVTIM